MLGWCAWLGEERERHDNERHHDQQPRECREHGGPEPHQQPRAAISATRKAQAPMATPVARIRSTTRYPCRCNGFASSSG